jgi:hypothetical protein
MRSTLGPRHLRSRAKEKTGWLDPLQSSLARVSHVVRQLAPRHQLRRLLRARFRNPRPRPGYKFRLPQTRPHRADGAQLRGRVEVPECLRARDDFQSRARNL